MRTFNPVSYDAFTELLARPDPADLPTRAHVCSCEGDPDRRHTRLPRILMGWLQRRHLEVDLEQTPALATWAVKRRPRQANPGLRVLRPTGTD